MAVRNIGRDANDQLKALQKDGDISEDKPNELRSSPRSATDDIKEIGALLQTKEQEIMESRQIHEVR